MATEGLTLEFVESGVQRLAEVAVEVNERTENIGARRLHTVMERLLETVSFDAADRNGTRVVINREYVEGNLGELVKDQDLSRYILCARRWHRNPPTSSCAPNRGCSMCPSMTDRISSCRSNTCACSRPRPRSRATAAVRGRWCWGSSTSGSAGLNRSATMPCPCSSIPPPL